MRRRAGGNLGLCFLRVGVYRHGDMKVILSVSPQRMVVAPGYSAPPSEVEDLIAGRQRKSDDTVYQAVFMRLLRGEEKQVCYSTPTRLPGLGLV